MSRKWRLFWAYVITTLVFGGAAIMLIASGAPGSTFTALVMIALWAIIITECRKHNQVAAPSSGMTPR